MRSILSFLTCAAALGMASTVGAQERAQAPKKAEPSVRVTGPETCTTVGGKTECRIVRRADIDSVLMKRAALGVQLGATGSVRDTIGVFVARVTPKGPAENAGIIEGDRIVSINGVDLRVNAADAGDSYASGLPSRRLTRELQKVTPGGRVNLRVWSGGRIRDVQVTAGRASDLQDRGSFGFMFDRLPGGTMTWGDMPRIRMESFPRMRMEDFPRLHLEGMPEMHLEDFPKVEIDRLRDGLLKLETERGLRGRPLVRVLTPSRSRVLTTTEPIVLGEDGEVILKPSKKKTGKK